MTGKVLLNSILLIILLIIFLLNYFKQIKLFSDKYAFDFFSTIFMILIMIYYLIFGIYTVVEYWDKPIF